VPKLSIIFGEILSRAHGNFEQQNGVLESCIVIINHYIVIHIIIIYIIIIIIIITVKLLRNCENKIVESVSMKYVYLSNQ
jgi:hypothetical protein